MPSPLDACIPIPKRPPPLRLVLPGGAALEHLDLMSVIGPALAPLIPMLDIVGAVVAVLDCIKAIPATIGPPPDPTALADSVAVLTEKVGKLLKLVPQLSVPMTVISAIDLVVTMLVRLRAQLMHLQQRAKPLAAAQKLADEIDDEGLRAIVQCALANLEQEAANSGAALAPLGALFDVLNVLLGLIGGPQLPSPAKLQGTPLQELFSPIDALVDALQQVRSAIPLP